MTTRLMSTATAALALTISAADSYTGTVKMETGRGAMTMKYNAKRVGDCVK